jgi:multidrug resistance efflux pump
VTAARAIARVPARRGLLVRVALALGIVVLIAAAGVFGFNAWRDSILYVSTDNAQITGQPVQVGAMNAGRVAVVNPAVGSFVHKADVLATIALPSQIGAAQSGTATMGFLGAVDTHVDVTAPFDGVVIATPAAAGSTVQVGQPVVTLVDPTQVWVNANIDETAVDRVQPGQSVSVHLDALNRDVPGRVESVTPATAATFSLIPGQNASGNYNKVTQLIPVRISLNLGTQAALIGSSVEVKIRVAE